MMNKKKAGDKMEVVDIRNLSDEDKMKKYASQFRKAYI